MAIVCKCKACGNRVSVEATIRPNCGQPHPALLPPATATVHDGRVTQIHRVGDAEFITVNLSSGIEGCLKVLLNVGSRRFGIGNVLRARVASVDSNSGDVSFSLKY
jgi:hypothetical protein